MSTRVKIIVAVLVIALLGGVAYLMFFNTNSDTSAVSATGGAPATAAQAMFIDLSQQINPISFDTSVLSDPRFTSLVDIHTAIVPDTEGRADPFAP